MAVDKIAPFQDLSLRVASACGLSGVEFGIVYADTPDGFLTVAMRVSLTDEKHEPVKASNWTHVGKIHALKYVAPLSTIGSLLAQLRKRELGIISGAPVRLRRTLNDPPSWMLNEEWSIGNGLKASRLALPLEELESVVSQQETRVLDREIAAKTDFKIVSLGRLVMNVTGQSFDRHREAELLMPWPFHSLEIERRGADLLIEFLGFSAIDQSQLVVTAERDAVGDIRYQGNDVRWTRALTGDRGVFSRFTTLLHDPEGDVDAVNLFFRGVPEISLRSKIQGEFASSLLSTSFKPKTIPQMSAGSRISALEVEGYRSFGRVSMAFTDLTVVIGRNQAGKSTILDSLDLIASGARGELSRAVARRGPFPTLLYRGAGSDPRSASFSVEVAIPSNRRARYSFRLRALGTYRFEVESENLQEATGTGWATVFNAEGGSARIGGSDVRTESQQELFITQLASPELSPVISEVRAALASIALFPGFRTGAGWPEGATVPMRSPAQILPGARLTGTGDNLVSALFALQSTDVWKRYEEIVRQAFPRLKELAFRAETRGYVQLTWKEEGVEFDSSELSDGTLWFLASLCGLYQQPAALVALDEPERHLHPEALYVLQGAARARSGLATILLTTQSNDLLRYLDDAPEALVVAKRTPSGAEFSRPDEKLLSDFRRDFSLAELRPELESPGDLE